MLNPELEELVLQLKQVQSEMENSLSQIKQSFPRFEQLLRKTSEMEEFNPQLTQQEKQELRDILKEATKIYNEAQSHTEDRRRNNGY